jgi:hypothetical protein
MTIQQAAQSALDVQDAVNLSGVVFAYGDAMRAVCDEAHRLGEGTAWKNTHPIAVVFASKVEHLTRCDDSVALSAAVVACRALAGLTP